MSKLSEADRERLHDLMLAMKDTHHTLSGLDARRFVSGLVDKTKTFLENDVKGPEVHLAVNSVDGGTNEA